MPPSYPGHARKWHRSREGLTLGVLPEPEPLDCIAVSDPVDVPALIRARLPELSPNDRRIAAWLLEHEAEAPFQTAESLARGAGVSKAAVVRFGSRLGFGGYAGLSEAMAGRRVAAALAPGRRRARRAARPSARPLALGLPRRSRGHAQRDLRRADRLGRHAAARRRRAHLRVRAAQVGEPRRVRVLPAQPARPERPADRLGHRLAGRPAARRPRGRPPARADVPAVRAPGRRGHRVLPPGRRQHRPDQRRRARAERAASPTTCSCARPTAPARSRAPSAGSSWSRRWPQRSPSASRTRAGRQLPAPSGAASEPTER